MKREALGLTPVKEIFLTNNKISNIETKSFGSNVQTLHLSCNKLSFFNPKWFKNVEILKELDLSANQLTTLQENIFKNFTNLETIVLEHNKIATIEVGSFSNRISFRSINLAHNLITELSPNIFENSIIKILNLKIDYNRLSFLSEDFLKKVNKTKAVIYGNPWKCGCYSSIKKWSEEEDTQYSYNYDYDNSDYEYQYEYVIKVKKTPKEDKRCMEVEDNVCDYKVDLEHIVEYEKNVTKRTTSEEFCKKLRD